MNNDFVPQSLQVAIDVEEAEYRKAKFQATVLWSVTMAAPLVGLGLWMIGIRVVGWLAQSVGLGVVAYTALYGLLPEARKMSTMRMKKYKELVIFRTAQAKLRAEQESKDSGKSSSERER